MRHFNILRSSLICIGLMFISQGRVMDLVLASEGEFRAMYVQGHWYRTRDKVVVDKVYTGAISSDFKGIGPYIIELLGDNDRFVSSANFGDREFSEGECRYGWDEEKQPFFAVLPYETSSQPQKLVIKKDGKIIWTRNKSLNCPLLIVNSPVNGDVIKDKITIKIKGSDKDGDKLLYMVEACGEPRDITDVKDRIVDTRGLCPKNRYDSEYELTIRILCSDGFNTTESSVKVLVPGALSIRSTTSPKDVNSPIEVAFNRTKINKDDINKESFLLLDAFQGDGPIEGDINLNCLEYDCKLVFKPKNPLELNTLYHAQVAAEVKDIAGNVLGNVHNRRWSFIVEEWHPVKDISPSGRDVSVESDIRVIFNDDIDKNTINAKSFILEEDDGKIVESMITYDDGKKTAVLMPLKNLAFNARYNIMLTNSITGTEGSPICGLGGITRFIEGAEKRIIIRSFTTGKGVRILDDVSDAAQDLNKDGLYDKLVLKMQVQILKPGRYNLNANLMDPAGTNKRVAYAIKTNLDFPHPGVYPVELEFKGADIARSAVDGPYEVYGLSIFDAGDGPNSPPYPELTYNFTNGHRTYPYKAKDFSL